MAVKYTEEQINTVDKSFLIHLLLQQQEQLEALTKELHASNEKIQLSMEQVILGKQNRFGKKTRIRRPTTETLQMINQLFTDKKEVLEKVSRENERKNVWKFICWKAVAVVHILAGRKNRLLKPHRSRDSVALVALESRSSTKK
ncbi:hypothetical protein AALH30_11700 [Blautia pseudococcoides]|uniref:hypothetical protein n=1 Tax=Blautia pseudococcoides TaxID=1796616 RepID=UPI001A9AC728|nr:hypothetical protein [Blautia pseudococcoides]